MSDLQRPLAGKVVLVTGGGGGLGAAIGTVLARAGARLAVADVRAQAAEAVAATLAGEGGGGWPLAMDVADAGCVERSIDAVVAEFGRLDAVINNAGIDITCAVGELATGDWDRVLATNLSGPFYVSRCALPHLQRSGGHIVNIVSTAARRAWPNASVYHASKWGLLGLSHALHAELRPLGIKVTAIIAGGMRTPFLLDRFPDIPLDNLQDPANVAESVRFALTQPAGTVIPEMMVLPMKETSWP